MTVWRGKYEQWRVVDERHRQSDAVRMELLELGEKADEKRSAFLNKLAMNTQRQRAEHESVRGAGARKRAAVQADAILLFRTHLLHPSLHPQGAVSAAGLVFE